MDKTHSVLPEAKPTDISTLYNIIGQLYVNSISSQEFLTQLQTMLQQNSTEINNLKRKLANSSNIPKNIDEGYSDHISNKVAQEISAEITKKNIKKRNDAGITKTPPDK